MLSSLLPLWERVPSRKRRRVRGLPPRMQPLIRHGLRIADAKHRRPATRTAAEGRLCHLLPQGERVERQPPLCAVAANQIETAPPFDHETRFMTDAPYISPLDQARILSQALPHMQRYDEETIVIKYGGHAKGAEDLAKAFARDIALLEQTAINPLEGHS